MLPLRTRNLKYQYSCALESKITTLTETTAQTLQVKIRNSINVRLKNRSTPQHQACLTSYPKLRLALSLGEITNTVHNRASAGIDVDQVSNDHILVQFFGQILDQVHTAIGIEHLRSGAKFSMSSPQDAHGI